MKVAIGACRTGHCDMAHPILCGECPDDNAYVIVGDEWTAGYGHCSVCGHHVLLGEHGVAWQHGPDLGDLLAEEVIA